ncbi:MAG: excinuclease ABC subunit UvrA [Planctomycetes bacterium]|nr:excinuclease ABC subunit UvrA [Planctomycetota bacterium]
MISSTGRAIVLRGVEVHNLKQVDLDLPHRKFIVFCGLSGSGKTSLAIDTLYAEGQRRYIESFSAYTRQFLERLEKPAAERIDGIPPAVAVTRKNASQSSRSTVATATEIADYLRLMYARIGQVQCPGCGRRVERDSPQSVAARLADLPADARYLIAFDASGDGRKPLAERIAELREDGFVRLIVGHRMVNLAEESADSGDELTALTAAEAETTDPIYVIVDRLTGGTTPQRVRDSLDLAFAKGEGCCCVFIAEVGPVCRTGPFVGGQDHEPGNSAEHRPSPTGPARQAGPTGGIPWPLDDLPWRRIGFSASMRCDDCSIDFPDPEPRLFSFNSPLGACPECEGFGNVIDMDMELIVPDRSKSLREGAVAPWNTPAYRHELDELLALAEDCGVPVDIPFRDLPEAALAIVRDGVPERKFGGLKGFFHWLERRTYKMHLRVYLSRWRSYRICPACGGNRLRPEALATRIGGLNIADFMRLRIAQARDFLEKLSLTPYEREVGGMMLGEVRSRLGYLETVGLEYLTLDRTLRTLSGGEAQRVALTGALGSSLVNLLYVLDEPSVGLHPRDVDRLVGAIRGLRDRGNTVVVVEHEESILRAADQIVEVGPGAGEQGGRIVFQGTPEEIENDPRSLTGDYLSGRRGVTLPAKRRTPQHGWIRLAGARGNNLKNITVEFPLGVLCVVTGVSGAGKSTLIQDTLYPALCRRMRKDAPKPLAYDDVFGDGQINDCVMMDQSPIGRSPRSNPVTYIKAFDEIRTVFAETVEARTNNYTAGHFSFNVDGGRCTKCQGDGAIQIDMQFLADVYMNCPQCGGTRYRPEILDVKYRGRSIADVLELTVREAFSFFRGRPKVQGRLKRLIDVGLDYLRLGQAANTLSGGEAQRLKLAAYISSHRRGRTLFLLDEPTTGLHFSDVVQLLDCFDALLAVGHSLIVVEHNVQVMKAADYVIDLGPGAADEGGRLGPCGTPEVIAREPKSITGQFLAQALAQQIEPVAELEE